jgi:hypothetical protein
LPVGSVTNPGIIRSHGDAASWPPLKDAGIDTVETNSVAGALGAAPDRVNKTGSPGKSVPLPTNIGGTPPEPECE